MRRKRVRVKVLKPGSPARLCFAARRKGRTATFAIDQYHPAGTVTHSTQRRWHPAANHYSHIDLALYDPLRNLISSLTM